MLCANDLFDALQPILIQVDNDTLQKRGVEREAFEACVNEKVSKYRDLFGLLDASFSSLCTIDPSEEECSKAHNRVTATMKHWRHLELSIMPKVHSFEDHAIGQMQCFGGIADKSEDFVEQSHQDGKREHRRTGRICNFRKRHNCAQRNEYIASDPMIQQQILDVHQSKRRMLTREVSLKEERTVAKKVAREEIRSEVMMRSILTTGIG